MKHNSDILNKLNKIDWNFSDYNSLFFPLDINSIHWYPASFVPQIPSSLIQILSNKQDLVLDPFCGSGVTILEAVKQCRRYLGFDLNPYAIKICKAKLMLLSVEQVTWFDNEIQQIKKLKKINNQETYLFNTNIDIEVTSWFEKKTLSELLSLHYHIKNMSDDPLNLIREILFSSILNKCCSQREHYTYITDNCRPKNFIYRSAIIKYLEQLELAKQSSISTNAQIHKIIETKWKPLALGSVKQTDARNLDIINDTSVDLIVTSPPYLGVNDYARSLRLTSMFFPDESYNYAIDSEIGSRRKRNRKNAFNQYITDITNSFNEIYRVLKHNSYFCLIVGQGRGKVNKENMFNIMNNIIMNDLNFEFVFKTSRKIKFRRIQVPGVDEESIYVFFKK